MLDNHVSVKQLKSIRNLKECNILIICILKCTRLSKKAHAAFNQGRGFVGEGVGLVGISSDGFYNIRYRHIDHILTFHMSGDTWPSAFYFFRPLWETARYRLNYCLKRPLNPNQPADDVHRLRVITPLAFITALCFFVILTKKPYPLCNFKTAKDITQNLVQMKSIIRQFA